jgi:hypothetical protein
MRNWFNFRLCGASIKDDEGIATFGIDFTTTDFRA